MNSTPNTIPTLNDDGLLPPGLFPCSFEELRSRFGVFRRSDQRVRLATELQKYLQELRETGFVTRILIDGSFVTSKDEPNDIDLIIVLQAHHDFSSTLKPHHYNTLSKRRVLKTHGFDILLAPEGSATLNEYIDFFQKTREGRSKGLLEVRP